MNAGGISAAQTSNVADTGGIKHKTSLKAETKRKVKTSDTFKAGGSTTASEVVEASVNQSGRINTNPDHEEQLEAARLQAQLNTGSKKKKGPDLMDEAGSLVKDLGGWGKSLFNGAVDKVKGKIDDFQSERELDKLIEKDPGMKALSKAHSLAEDKGQVKDPLITDPSIRKLRDGKWKITTDLEGGTNRTIADKRKLVDSGEIDENGKPVYSHVAYMKGDDVVALTKTEEGIFGDRREGDRVDLGYQVDKSIVGRDYDPETMKQRIGDLKDRFGTAKDKMGATKEKLETGVDTSVGNQVGWGERVGANRLFARHKEELKDLNGEELDQRLNEILSEEHNVGEGPNGERMKDAVRNLLMIENM